MKYETIFLFCIVLATTFYKSQTVTVRGIAKDSLKINNIIGIVVNDTIKQCLFGSICLESQIMKNRLLILFLMVISFKRGKQIII